MSSPESRPVLGHIVSPLRFAESLLDCYERLGRAASAEMLFDQLAASMGTLSGCLVAQVYLLDATHTSLQRVAQWAGAILPLDGLTLSADYADQQLLQFCLCQQRAVSIDDLCGSPCDSSFLPGEPKCGSLLCLPWVDSEGHGQGVLVCAAGSGADLDSYIEPLQSLASFALNQYQLLSRLRTGAASGLRPGEAQGLGLLGDSAGMQRVAELIGKVLHSPLSVLITGETGTGKELVARAIHQQGMRSSRPFVVQNCASLPEHLLESELFGYRKGAFSGADRDYQGLLDAADGGTLFLDEVGDMPLTLQAKLLRVLQEGEVRPLGSTQTHRVDVRVLAATHQDLSGMVRRGEFREDLYYRLSGFPITLPPLRERGSDILMLARHFADQACQAMQRTPCRWSAEALGLLESYEYPGNVRELKAIVERAVLMCESSLLLPGHFGLRQPSLAAPSAAGGQPMGLRESMELLERQLLLQSLRRNNGNQTHAARELGLPRRTLLYRMERLRITTTDI